MDDYFIKNLNFFNLVNFSIKIILCHDKMTHFFFNMMKKMGRPTRKMIASTLVYELPDGEIIYFEIDKKGNAQMIKSNNHHVYPNDESQNIQIIPVDKLDEKSQNSDKSDEKLDQKTLDNESIIIKNLNSFLKQIENHISFDTFMRDFKLSDRMLFPINA